MAGGILEAIPLKWQERIPANWTWVHYNDGKWQKREPPGSFLPGGPV
jgi:hypothetical protein